MAKRIRSKVDVRDVAEEIVRRALAEGGKSDGTFPYVVRISDPPTTSEQLKLAACRILRIPIAIMPAKC